MQPRTGDAKQYKGVWSSLVRMFKEEGFRGLMRGNGINCVRIIPYSAVQFTTYEQLKKVRSRAQWVLSVIDAFSFRTVVHAEWSEGVGYPNTAG